MQDRTSDGGEAWDTTPATEQRCCDVKPPEKDDLDLLLLHEDFPKLLTMAAQVKTLRAGCDDDGKATTLYSFESRASKDSLSALSRMQSKLLSSPPASTGAPTIAVFRGEDPLTDAMLDVAMMELQDELDAYKFETVTQQPFSPASDSLLLDALSVADPVASVAQITPVCSPSSAASASSSPGSDRRPNSDPKKKGDAIAIKYSKWQTDIFMKWMIDHAASPFPETSDVEDLARATGLSHSQVVNWTTNVRKRNLKATCKGSKKPHHFIDFLFLKQHQESRKSAVAPPRGSRPGAARQPQPILSLPPGAGGSASKPRARSRRRAAGDASGRSVSAESMPNRFSDYNDIYHVDELQLLTQPEIGELEPLDWKDEEHGMLQRCHHHSELLDDFASYWEDDDKNTKYLLPTSSGHWAEEATDLDASSTPLPAKLPSYVCIASPAEQEAYRRSLLRSITFESQEYLMVSSANASVESAGSIKPAPYTKRHRPTTPPLADYFLADTDADTHADADECEPLFAHDDERDNEDDWIKTWDIDEVGHLPI